MRFAALFLAFLSLFGCYSVMTEAELQEQGTRRYSNVSRAKATEGVATSLATLGYNVTLKQPDRGIIKTAPHSIMVSATGNANQADLMEDGLAWNIAVKADGTGVIIRATPRGFRNGSEMHDDNMWVHEAMDSKFKDLWGEVNSTLASK